MKGKLVTAILSGLVSVIVVPGCGDNNSGGESSDAGSDSGTEPSSMTTCSGGHLDPATNLCWLDPSSTSEMNWYEATGTADSTHNPGGATDFCGDGTWGGHTDWRMPDIGELISLMRGCASGSATGDLSTSNCGVYDPGCLGSNCDDIIDCSICFSGDGPGSGGCYCDPVLSGACSWYWSSSLFTNYQNYAWYVNFANGNVGYADKNYSGRVRCVRTGPAEEPSSMTSCDGGYLDPATDLCWQDPPSTSDMNWYEATGTADSIYNNPDGGVVNHCGDGTWGGHTDWRMPEIDELISLIRGCVDGTATDDLSTNNCGVDDPSCLTLNCSDGPECYFCQYMKGPGFGGCYWDPALSETCDVYWSSSHMVSGTHAWFLYFFYGTVNFAVTSASMYVRCVRDES